MLYILLNLNAETGRLYPFAGGKGLLSLQLVPLRTPRHLSPYLLDHLAESYSHLVAFATKFTQKEGTGETIETIDGVARYGTLLRIQRLDPVKAPPAEKTREPQVGYLGLNFARFKIISLTGQEGAVTASIEISADEISKEAEDYIKKKGLFAKLKQELKLYFECGLRGA
jgi:hypothetical protein